MDDHFKNKDYLRALFDYLVEKISKEIGKVEIISIPCCIHLFGTYDFLVILPKKDKLEIRFASDRKVGNERIKADVPLSKVFVKNALFISSQNEIDKEFMTWVKESYHLKDKSD